MNIVETILNISTEHIRNLFGEFDCHAKLIEKTMNHYTVYIGVDSQIHFNSLKQFLLTRIKLSLSLYK